MIGFDEICLIALFIESVLYGLHILLFIISIIIIRQRWRRLLIDSVGAVKVLTVSILMMIFASMHIGVNFRRILYAFIYHQGNASEDLADFSSTPNVVSVAAYYLQTLVGDAFALYRANAIWDGNLLVMVPLYLCFGASAAVGIATINNLAHSPTGADPYTGKLGTYFITLFALTLLTNAGWTGLIAVRIWWLRRRVRRFSAGVSTNDESDESFTQKVMEPGNPRATIFAGRVIVESGILNSVFLIISLALYAAKIEYTIIFLDSLPQVVGLVFLLIIVRVTLGLTGGCTHTSLRALPQGNSSLQTISRGTFNQVASPASAADSVLWPVVVNIGSRSQSPV